MNYNIVLLLISFAIATISGLFVIKELKKLKVRQSEREDGPESHLSKQGTPTMGGIIMIISVVITTIIAYIYNKELALKMIPIMLAAIGFGLIGFIDDYKKVVLKNTDGISPKAKMFGLLIISILFVVYLTHFLHIDTVTLIPFLKTDISLPIYIFIPFMILVMLATTNAVNLTDGIDGLATSICLIIIASLSVIGILYSVPEISMIGSIACGACLGFLLYNLNKAKVFMGDTGSLYLGGLISCMAIYLKMPLILIIIALVPVCETLSVIMQVAYYKRTKKRIFKMTPIHHHFELSGWRENKIVRIFSLITLILCVIGIFSVI